MDQMKASFKRDRYLSIQGLLPPAHTNLLRSLYSKLLQQPSLFPGARWIQQYRRYEYVSEPFAAIVNYQLSELVEVITGTSLVATYAFPVIYESEGHINPHRDVKDNHFSLSYSIASVPDQQPIGSA